MRSAPNVDPTATAHTVARSFAAADPAGSLADLGIALLVRGEPLRLPGKRVRGCWDPCLRRIELHGCRRRDADRDLVRILGHEMGHALPGVWSRQQTRKEEEVAADTFAHAWLEALGTSRIRRCGSALRNLAGRAEYSATCRTGKLKERRGWILPIG